MENAKQNDIPLKTDTALFKIEQSNESLRGALPDNYYSRLGIYTNKLAAILDAINKIDTVKDKELDIIGLVYEYFSVNSLLRKVEAKVSYIRQSAL